MTISMKVFGSHKYSFQYPAKYVFKIVLVPEKVTTARGFHYVLLVDTSGSMEGFKIELARKGALELLNRIPEGNKVSVLSFGERVNLLAEAVNPADASRAIQDLTAEGSTPLYSALLTAISLIKKYGMPSYLILLTDGNPTDVTVLDNYKGLEFPSNVKAIAYGIGDDYNEVLLRLLADKTGGIFEHVSDVNEIVKLLPKAAVTKVGAQDVTVDIKSEGQVRLFNFEGPPVRLNAVESAVTIWGELTLPGNYSGDILRVAVTYFDPATQMRQTMSQALSVQVASTMEQYSAGIDKDLVAEYNYYVLLDKYGRDLSAANLGEATKTLNQLTQLAQQTRRLDMMEQTKRLQNSLEQTRRLGSVEATKRLAKEVQSEVTKKLRSS
ncbi:MAG: VWA domain-containing protein [Sulfolobales archaeon]|nr:VWA domain-containing protein [Sulfolobales archaeon]MCG2894301.1 VWA domain-containing protein [Sulfolobales archaeon]MCG2911233.1 VWA domain-containing protein [Sulfolobales archaeon]